ncbi:MAG: regulatory signaling modulator protein AmpE [bacterium]
MTLFTVIIALILDRVLWDADPYRQHTWFDKYLGLFDRQQWLRVWLQGPFASIIIISPLIIVTAWLQSIFHDGWNGILEWAFGTLVLLLSLGPEELGRATERYLGARDTNPETANKLAKEICGEDVPDQEPLRALSIARCILVAANDRLFAPLFWFIVLGPVGAVAYRGIMELSLRNRRSVESDDEFEETQSIDPALAIADWIPARLTALSYAVAGNFEAVAHIWTSASEEAEEGSRQLLREAGTAAMDSYPVTTELEDLGETPPVVEDALALLWRSLSLWVIVLIISQVIFWLA